MRIRHPWMTSTLALVCALAAFAQADDAPPAPAEPAVPAVETVPAVEAAPAGAEQAAPVPEGPKPAQPAIPEPAAPPPAAPCLPESITVCPPQCLAPCAKRWAMGLAGGASWMDSPAGIVGLEPAPANPLEWGTLEYPAAFAGRGSLAYRAGGRWGVAVRGTYWGKTDDEGTDAGNWLSASAPGDTDLSRPLAGSLSGELTLWDVGAGFWFEWCCSPCTVFVAGFGGRLARLDESVRLDFAVTDVGPATSGSLASDVENELLLAEVSLGWRWVAGSRCTLGFTVTGLVGGVTSDVDVSDENVFTSGVHAGGRKDEDTTYGLQLDLVSEWRMSSRCGLTVGYSLLWLDNIQRASTALDLSQSGTGAVQAASTPEDFVAHALLVGISFDF